MNNVNSPRPDTDETIEAEIKRKGLTAPRITPAEIGRRVALAAAKQKIWPLEGYVLKQHLFDVATFRSITEPVTG